MCCKLLISYAVVGIFEEMPEDLFELFPIELPYRGFVKDIVGVGSQESLTIRHLLMLKQLKYLI